MLPYKDVNGKLVEKNDDDDSDSQRQFTVHALQECSIRYLKIEDLNLIEEVYPDYYEEIFANQIQKFKEANRVKREVIK